MSLLDFQVQLNQIKGYLFAYAVSLTHNRVYAKELFYHTIQYAMSNRDQYLQQPNFKAWIVQLMRETYNQEDFA